MASPLLDAALQGDLEVVEVLLKRAGADPQAKDGEGSTALHLAAQGGHRAVVALLLDRGLAVAAANNEGVTPLHCAARGGDALVVWWFLDGGAPVKPAAFMLVIGLPPASPVKAVPGAAVVGASIIMELPLAYPAALYSGLPAIAPGPWKLFAAPP